MRITLASKWAHQWNGMCQVVGRIATHLSKRGHKVSWVANEGNIDPEWIDNDVTIVETSSTPLQRRREILEHVSNFVPDVVHAHDSQGLYFIEPDVPLITTSHSNWPRSWLLSVPSFITSALVDLPQDILLHASDEVVAVSEYSSRMLSYKRISSKTIINGVEIPPEVPDEGSGFVAIGTVDERKAKCLPDIWREISSKSSDHLDVVGKIVSEDIANELRALPNATVHGKVECIEPFYRENSTLLFPSRAEACPLTVLEAQAYGLSVVGWDICSNDELLGESTGTVVPPYDVSAFANAARRTHNTTDARVCWKWAKQNFDGERMVSEYDALYRRMSK